MNPEQYNGAVIESVLDGTADAITQLNPDAAYDGTAEDNRPAAGVGTSGSPEAMVIDVPTFESATDAQIP